MTKCVFLVVYFQKYVHRARLKPIIKINNNNNNKNNNNNNNNDNNNSFRMVPTSFFIIHEKFQNLPDIPTVCRMKMSSMEADKFQP